MISVIIAAFNADSTIDRCINSVLAAKKNHTVELIVIDDGSVDGTAEILQQWVENEPWIIVRHQKNGGAAAARNSGLDLATGNYIVFVDSDDTIDTWYFDFIFENAVNKNLDALIFGHKRVILNGSSIERKNINANYSREDLQQIQLRVTEHRHLYWYTWSRVYHKRLIGSLRFDPAVKIGEDPIFNIKCINQANSVSVMSDCPYNYYETPNSLTSSIYKPSLLETVEAHYKARVEAHIWPENLVERQILLSDFARSYIEHMLPYLLNNLAYLTISERYKELIRIRNSFIYKDCIPNYISYHAALSIRLLIKYFSKHRYLATLGLLQLLWTKKR